MARLRLVRPTRGKINRSVERAASGHFYRVPTRRNGFGGGNNLEVFAWVADHSIDPGLGIGEDVRGKIQLGQR